MPRRPKNSSARAWACAASSGTPWMRQLRWSTPAISWQEETTAWGVSTTSSLSRLNSENTASMPRAMKSPMKREVAQVPATFFVSTSRSAPSASP
jgi:hypothetical protein